MVNPEGRDRSRLTRKGVAGAPAALHAHGMGNGPVMILIALSSLQLSLRTSSFEISLHWMIPSSRLKSVLTKKGIDGKPSAMQTQLPSAPDGRRPTGVNPGE